MPGDSAGDCVSADAEADPGLRITQPFDAQGVAQLFEALWCPSRRRRGRHPFRQRLRARLLRFRRKGRQIAHHPVIAQRGRRQAEFSAGFPRCQVSGLGKPNAFDDRRAPSLNGLARIPFNVRPVFAGGNPAPFALPVFVTGRAPEQLGAPRAERMIMRRLLTLRAQTIQATLPVMLRLMLRRQ